MDQQTILNWLAVAFWGLLTAVGLLYRSKVDALEKERVNYVTHEDLEKHLDKIAEERRVIAEQQSAQHTSNTRRLERIEDSLGKGLDRIHDRIDALQARDVRDPQARTRQTDG